MAIKRISELDYCNDFAKLRYINGNYADRRKGNIRPDKEYYAELSSKVLFELSWWLGQTNEAKSYYVSQKINGYDLRSVIAGDIEDKISTILSGWCIFIGLKQFGEANAYFNDYKENGVPRDDQQWATYIDTEDGNRRKNLKDADGNNIPNRLCCLVSADFTNYTEFHGGTEFHNTVNQYDCFSSTKTQFMHLRPVLIRAGSNNVGLTIQAGDSATNSGTKLLHVHGKATFDDLITGCCTSAWWADLAEMYEPDRDYSPGTLVKFGGEKEITVATGTVNGVITSKPGYVLNGQREGDTRLMKGVALTGRVPVRVLGKVEKFDKIILSATPGVGIAVKDTKDLPDYLIKNVIIGIALESSDDPGEKLIECVTRLHF